MAVFLGASLQSATGFGFALIAAPILFAVFGAQEAVTAGVLLGVTINLQTLATERRMPRVLGAELLVLVGQPRLDAGDRPVEALGRVGGHPTFGALRAE